MSSFHRIVELIRQWRTTRPLAALAMGGVLIVLVVVQGIFALQHSGYRRNVGWRAAPTSDGWVIEDVATTGPAHNLLAPGDRIVAINGEPTAAKIGPHWMLGPQTAGRSYTVRASHSGVEYEVPLTVERQADPLFATWALLYFAIAVVYLAVGLIIVWQRSVDSTARYCYWACIATTAVMLHLTSRRDDAALTGAPLVVAELLLCFYPLHFLFGYLFLARFPRSVEPGGVWRVVKFAIVAGCAVTWLARVVRSVVTAAGDRGVALLIDQPWIALTLDRVMLPIESFVMLAVCVACVAVTARNYTTLEDLSQRRRLRWLAVGLAAAVIPIAAVQLARIATGGVKAGAADGATIRLAMQYANVFVMIQPVALAYAVLRHRVLGVHVAVRLGIQYMLAKSVLQVVLLLPLLSLILHVVLNPSVSMTELIFGDGSRLNAGVLVGAALALRYRPRIGASIDRRFFREAYDQEQILLSLVDEVPQAESIEQLSQLVAVQLGNALHPAVVQLFYLDNRRGVLTCARLPGASEDILSFSPESRWVRAVEHNGAPMEVRHLLPLCSTQERTDLARIGAEVLAPVLGVNGRLRGLLVLGAKRSEEPYTAKDRALLRTITAQIGAVHEVLELRETVNSERRIQHEVLARFESSSVDVLRECPRCGACYGRDAIRCERDGNLVEFTLPVPSLIDAKYRLIQRIGSGGMGVVFEATDVRLRRPVAVKIMLGVLFGSTTAQRRFEREAQASARIEHPHIVRTYDYGILSSGGGYLVMERVHGRSWRETIAEIRASHTENVAELFDQLCNAMSAAHSAGVIHRDLKPANILVSRVGEKDCVKVLDFGLAKIRTAFDARAESTASMSGVAGTAGYVAPELFAGAIADERADVFSIGVIAIEALTETFPSLSRISPDTLELAVSHHFDITPPTPERRRIAQVLRRSVASDVETRYASVQLLRADLVPAIAAVGSQLQHMKAPRSLGAVGAQNRKA